MSYRQADHLYLFFLNPELLNLGIRKFISTLDMFFFFNFQVFKKCLNNKEYL